ncbi:hypothetical protein O181_003061 [Austropuccinia psidii MF-1]|uniref:Uncharacterized protein n=1 Tax=Austropuccinia psidii MF-1 TaxID=1389203 RepID=A0A9Q3GDS9_9BASI|nr:hypothetical protein [Austropuccinia psidii MF-1]
MPTLPFTFALTRNLKPEYLEDMDQALQLLKPFKYFVQWNMYTKRFNLASHWEELGEGFQKIFLKEIHFKDLMVITKGWNFNRNFELLEEMASSIR